MRKTSKNNAELCVYVILVFHTLNLMKLTLKYLLNYAFSDTSTLMLVCVILGTALKGAGKNVYVHLKRQRST